MPNKIKKFFMIFTFSALIASPFLFGITALALDAPDLQSRVNDYADILSPQTESLLEAKLEQLEKNDSTQLVVLTIPSLEGDVMENFSIRVAEKWKIGHKKLDNGAILLISKNDRKIRIEVGYGLEGKLTDLVSGRIIKDIIAPNFKKGNFDQGVIDAVDAITSVVKGEFTAQDAEGKKEDKGFFSGNIVLIIVFVLFFLGAAGSFKRIFGGILGAVIFPVAGLIALPFTLWLLLLIPAGFLAGIIVPAILSGIGRGGGGGFFGGSGGGGFSSFSGSSDSSGGFSGGGGSFGGGGASGDW